jgi:hypothetical protein
MSTLTLALMFCVLGCTKQRATPEAKPPPRPPVATRAPLQRPTVPPELAVPDDHKLVLIAKARGAQIYECVADPSDVLAWRLHAPSADLFDDAGTQIGVHFGGIDKNLPPGPYWESTDDGSRVHGASPVSAPNQGSIPLLRLQAADTSGNGVFSKVSFIHRLATTGGVAPPESCMAGKRTEVLYTALYYFYAAP